MPNPHHDAQGRFSSGGSGGRKRGERSPAQRHASGSGSDMVSTDHLDKLSIRYGDPNQSPYFDNDPIVSALVKDMKKNGVKEPVTVQTDGRLGYLSDGNHRVAAAKIAGIKSLPTRFVRTPSSELEGMPIIHESIQSKLSENPSLARTAVQRQKSWSQNER
jgi:hypothetical protein